MDSYRGRKDSSVALYHMWRMGEVMVHHRERFERVYTLTERVAPADLLAPSSDADADDFLIKKEIAFYGLHNLSKLGDALQRKVSRAELLARRTELLAAGEIVEVQVESWKGPHYTLASAAVQLREISQDRLPKSWHPLDTSTDDEVVFLAPLDVTSAARPGHAAIRV